MLFSYTCNKSNSYQSNLENWCLLAPENPQDAGVPIFNSRMLISRPDSKAENICAENLDGLIISQHPEVMHAAEYQSHLQYFITQSFPATALHLNHTMIFAFFWSDQMFANVTNLKNTLHIRLSSNKRSLSNK